MRLIVSLVILLSFTCLNAQDKIYLLDGSNKNCKVTAVTPDYLEIIEPGGAESAISRVLILLVEYKNGSVEIYNSPKDNVTYNPNIAVNSIIEKKEIKAGTLKNHHVSFNSLALMNADIAAFYEYYPNNKPFSFGVMGAYNFNLRTNITNAHFAFLSNSKKNYDLGANFNVYTSDASEGELRVFIGLMCKYTNFSFDLVKIDSVAGPVGSSQIVTFTKTKGYQMATMVTLGADIFMNEDFFIKGFAGLGAFALRGDYKIAFNEQRNNNLGNGQVGREYNYAAKMYLGINIGFNF